MSLSDYYAEWVERRKYEDTLGRWWRTDGETSLIGAPYDTEDELDKVLWDAALDGEALPSAP